MEMFLKIMKYIMRIWLAEYSSVYNVCCEVISLFPGQLCCCYLLSLSLSSPAITPPHLCNFQWLPFTTLIWCTCMSPITATCFIYLTPVSPEFLLLMQRVWQHFLVILCTVCDLISLRFVSFFYFGKLRNPVKWFEESQLTQCSDI